MDRLIYTAMTGAKQTMARQDTLAHNLANATTTGFRANTTAFRAVPLQGPGAGTRVFAIESTPGTDFSTGPIQQTGRELDVAVNGDGFIAVQARDGSEAYTRAGNLQMDQDGKLVTNDGLPVLGDGGPIEIPADTRVHIAYDGTLSALDQTGKLNNVNVIGRLKLVNPPVNELTRGGDGLFRAKTGEAFPLDDTVTVTSGVIEGSNVNVVEAMVGIIAAARQFEMQMKMLSTAEADSRAASQLLNING